MYKNLPVDPVTKRFVRYKNKKHLFYGIRPMDWIVAVACGVAIGQWWPIVAAHLYITWK